MADIERLKQDIQKRFGRLVQDSDLLHDNLPSPDAIFILCALEEACERLSELIDRLDRLG
jgi:hypothetical protein